MFISRKKRNVLVKTIHVSGCAQNLKKEIIILVPIYYNVDKYFDGLNKRLANYLEQEKKI